MQKLLTSFLLVVFIVGLSYGQDTLRTDIYFDVDMDDPIENELAKLDLELARNEKLKQIILTGHTDSDGSDTYNDDLSKRRVINVQNYLKAKVKVPISIDYYGEKEPVSKNDHDQGKQKNRRVEVSLVFVKDTSHYITMEDVYNELSSQEQVFTIRTNRDTVLTLNEGTVVNISANTFTTATNRMILTVKEVYDYTEMIGERTTTNSNGRQLETGGMLNIKATDENGNLISADKELAIFMPTDDIKEDMQVFYGDHDPHHNINWQLGDSLNTNSGWGSGITGVSNSFLNEWGLIPPLGLGCPFFWCRVRNGVSRMLGIVNKEWMFAERTDLYQEYRDSIRGLMDSLGVNSYAELQEKLVEGRINEGNASSTDMGYYAFSSSRLGWINCDRFVRRDPLITMNTEVDANDDNFTSLVFLSMSSIFSGRSNGQQTISFYRVPKGDPVYHVIIKTEKDKVLLSTVRTEVNDNAPPPNFETLKLSELKGRLAGLQ